MPNSPDANAEWLAPPNTRQWIGLDVGGANLKAADGRGRAESRRFPLWKQPERLSKAVAGLLTAFDPASEAAVALTMTGELADCYEAKSEGVRAIVDAVELAAAGRRLVVATVDDRWRTPSETCDSPLDAAAANWRLGARLVAAAAPGDGDAIWVDVGSTTTDVVRVVDGVVASDSRTDNDRLRSGELVYTGVGRTPVCAVVSTLPYRGDECPVMAEWFATTADAWLVAGEMAEDADDRDTADGRPLTRPHAIARLARCVGADRESFTDDDARATAHRIIRSQAETVADAIRRNAAGPQPPIIVSGSGEPLAVSAARLVTKDSVVIKLSKHLGVAASSALPAHASAVLASREVEA